MSNTLQNLPELREYFIKNILVADNASDDLEENENSTNIREDNLRMGYQISQNTENELFYKVDFHVIIKDESKKETKCAAFIEGYFSFDEQSDSEKREYLIRVQGCTTLYGILRGIFSSVTSMTRSGKVILPNIMMHEVVKELEEKRQNNESKEASFTEE